MIKNFTCLMVLFLLFASCVSKKNIVYLQNSDNKDTLFKQKHSYDAKIKPLDLLHITIASQDADAVKPFNLSVTEERPSYLVDSNGEIELPILGKLKVVGLTKNELIGLLKKKLSPDYVKDPYINILIGNFKVSVLGDVRAPGLYEISNERITILEAIALAGDLNISAQRDNILIVRETIKGVEKVRVNLLSDDLINSPFYYLQQNDMIYIEPNYAQSQRAATNPSVGFFTSLITVLLAVYTILIR